MEYRGIKLAHSVNLFKKCGGYNKNVLKSLDALKDTLEERGHKILSEYKDVFTKVLIEFNCGHEPRMLSPKDYRKGIGCNKCSGRCSNKAKNDFLNLLGKNNHTLLSDYDGVMEKVLIDFNCGHKPHWLMPITYKRGTRCPKCSEKCPEQSKEKLAKLIKNNNHTLLSDYINNISKVLIDFNCGHEPHWITPNDYKQGYGCPRCVESKGEKIIREWLESEKIPFKTQYNFPSQRKRYDFCLPFDNLIVEIHGKQHYGFVDIFHQSEEGFLKEQENDRLKEEYARSLGYEYMVIDYREHNPQLALERFKKQYKDFKEKN